MTRKWGNLKPIGTEPYASNDVLSNLAETIHNAKTVGDLVSAQRNLFSFEAFSYHILLQPGTDKYDAKGHYWTDSLPAPIKEYYNGFNGKPDPTIDYVLSRGAPFWLSELRDDEAFVNEITKPLLDTAMTFTGDGLVLPLYGPFHKRGCMFLSFEKKRDFFETIFKWQLQGVAQSAHVKYCLLTNSIRHTINLTPRESEVLELITFGKTNPEIGKILKISTSTVSGYVKQIFLKLDVTDRVTAAMKARTFKP